MAVKPSLPYSLKSVSYHLQPLLPMPATALFPGNIPSLTFPWQNKPSTLSISNCSLYSALLTFLSHSVFVSINNLESISYHFTYWHYLPPDSPTGSITVSCSSGKEEEKSPRFWLQKPSINHSPATSCSSALFPLFPSAHVVWTLVIWPTQRGRKENETWAVEAWRARCRVNPMMRRQPAYVWENA